MRIACGQELNDYIKLDVSCVCLNIQGQFDTVTVRCQPAPLLLLHDADAGSCFPSETKLRHNYVPPIAHPFCNIITFLP